MNTVSRARWNVQYMQRVLALDPIAGWMQNEKQGADSYDMVTARSDGSQNGTYTGVTLGQPGIGDGNTCPLFDGVNDYNDIYSATLDGVFNGLEGSFLLWYKVTAVGIWTDGATGRTLILFDDGNNFIILDKAAANNRIEWFYTAGGVSVGHQRNGVNATEWISLGMSWSDSGNEVRYYYNGIDELDVDAPGTWNGGGLDPVRTLIGANSQVPTSPTSGYLAHAWVWDRALTPAESLSVGVL